MANALEFFGLVARGKIHSAIPIPLSLLVVVLLARVSWSVAKKYPTSLASSRWRLVLVTGVFLITFPLAQIFFFGSTSYARRADVAVVFGARAYADGTPSDALGDRVTTACQLYRDGFVRKLIFSGGPGDGSIDEPHAMRTMAMQLGVPDDAIELDPHGVTTAATVANTTRLFREQPSQRILVVSHFFHLPRIKLAYQRAGVEVYTVPSPQRRPLASIGKMLARETAAWWFYYLR
jgi:vancomycin permeability regulator SanA